MNCVIYIKTNKPIDEIKDKIIELFNSNSNVNSIFNSTSLATKPNLSGMYFHGYDDGITNFLFAKENTKTLRIFIEVKVKRENLNQLKSSIDRLIENIRNNGIENKETKAIIWSEDEEMLSGVYLNYWKRLKNNLSDIPFMVYTASITFLYTLIFNYNNFSYKIVTNYVVVIIGLIIWMLIKSGIRKENIKFNIR